MKLFSSLRSRVWLMVALVALPLLADSLAVYSRARDETLARLENALEQHIRFLLGEESRLAGRSRELLRLLADGEELRRFGACPARARRLLEIASEHGDAGPPLPDAKTLCGALAAGRTAADAGLQPWFREIAADWLERSTALAGLPPGWQVLLLARDGKLLPTPRQASAAARWPGERLAALVPVAGQEGLREVADAAGEIHLAATAPLASLADDLLVAVVAPTAPALKPARQDLVRRLFVLALAAALSLFFGTRALQLSLRRWTEGIRCKLRPGGAVERVVRPAKGVAARELREIDAGLDGLLEHLRQAGEALGKSRQELDRVLECAEAATWEMGLADGEKRGDARFSRMLGDAGGDFPADEAGWRQRLHPEDLPAVAAALEAHLAGDKPLYECEYRVRHRAGHWIWLRERGRVSERGSDGRPLRVAGTATDITRGKALEEEARERGEELAVLLEILPAPLWITRSADGRGMLANRAAQRLSGQQDGGPPPECGSLLRRAMADGRAAEACTTRFTGSDGQERELRGSAAPLFDGAGAVRGALAAFIDAGCAALGSDGAGECRQAEIELIRHRERLENLVAERTRELEMAREAAERACRSRSRFLANISHELRTPLNSLMLLAHVLSSNSWDNLNPQQLEYARLIESAGADLVQLIDELLDLARIEGGRPEVRARPVPFPDIMQNVRRLYRHVAQAKGLDLRMEIAPDVPASISTDPLRLQQILRNLIFNAIKFTDAGSVTLRIRRAVSGAQFTSPALAAAGAVVAFDVVDTGIGISSEKQSWVFDLIGQQPGSAEGDGAGRGLGLSIAREIASLLGGELALASAPGQGSTFTLYLPLAPAGVVGLPEPAAGASPAGPAPVGLAGKRVLVVDDDERNRFALTALLAQHGMTVLAAASAPEAIRLLAGQEVDAVLMDILMPGIDGCQATRSIRAEISQTLPIIALTSSALPGVREDCLSAGCSDYLVKPVDNDQLLDRLQSCLSKARKGRPARAPVAD